MKITRIAPAHEKRNIRVAAYCRVSTQLESQEESFRIQQEYYMKYICANPQWEFAGVYADEKSGTSVEHREGFRRMIADALAGMADRILVKSISRFSRNAVDAQFYVKLLHSHGVSVYFEKEGIDTAESSSLMMLSLIAAIAQDESRSISENIRWSYRERFQRGEYNLGNNRILGYDTVNGQLVPNHDAWIIREIFRRFVEGENYAQIARELNRMGARRMRSGNGFVASVIQVIVGNETYVGDKRLQKRAPQDFLTKKPGEHKAYTSYYIKEDHEGIIDRQTWERAQAILCRHREELACGVHRKGGRHHVFFGKIFCGTCGSPFCRRTLSGTQGYYKAWSCRERHKGRSGNGCKNRVWREEELIVELRVQLGWENFDHDRFAREIRKVELRENGRIVPLSYA